MSDVISLLDNAAKNGVCLVRFVSGRAPVGQTAAGEQHQLGDRALSEDALAAFLLDNVASLDVGEIFSDETLAGEVVVGGRPCQLLKQRKDELLTVQVKLVQEVTHRRADTGVWQTAPRATEKVPAISSPPGGHLDGSDVRAAMADALSALAARASHRPPLVDPDAETGVHQAIGDESEASLRQPMAAQGSSRSAATQAPQAKVTALANKGSRPANAQQRPAPATSRSVVAQQQIAQHPALDTLLDRMVEANASDIHISAEHIPWIRVDGILKPMTDAPIFSSDNIAEMAQAIAPHAMWEQFEDRADTDFAYERGRARFRCNLFMDRHGVGIVARCIPMHVPTADELGLTNTIRGLCTLPSGLVLVTGPTGSGKSTTLAAMVDLINRERDVHIVTVEDPIEYVHESRRALINQREVGSHTQSFPNALRAALREDPDVVLIGELRDLETTRIALKTAETGHLVFGTLHTNSATTTVDRIINQFPGDERDQVRLSLSETLRAVLSQTLCKKRGSGRAMAMEVLLANRALANLVREARTFQIPSLIQTARGEGMQMMNDALLALLLSGQIDEREALLRSSERAALKNMIEKATKGKKAA
ncbi:MAG: twitching motility protein PilT [Bradymonadia bacterium]|jgi:twitching motility protein PilT